MFRVIWIFFITFCSWHVLKIIGGSLFSGFTVIIPVFGYVIFYGSIKNGIYYFDFTNFSWDKGIAVSEFTFIRLKLTYIGLSIIGFSTIVYRILCPKEVASHRNEATFIEASVANTHNAEYARTLKDMVRKRWYDIAIPERVEIQDIVVVGTRIRRSATHADIGDQPLRRSDWLEKNLDGLNAVYSTKYKTTDYSRLFTRYVIFTGFLAGFIITLIPSIQIFYPTLIEVIAFLEKELFQ